MVIMRNVPLSGYSTMRLGGTASYLCEINKKEEVAEAYAWASERGLPTVMIGIGSNIVWRDEGFDGLVLVNKILGFSEYQEDNDNLYVTIGAGENWDETVAKIVERGYSGVEELSLIPGTVGATPVQNVGAYGREIKNTLTTVEAFDTRSKQLVNIPSVDCDFGYRSSRFNRQDKGRFFITAVTLHVMRLVPQPPFYPAVDQYLKSNDVSSFTPKVIRDAVIAIRSAKLPDPAVVANCGSFFYNPIVKNDLRIRIQSDNPELIYWPTDDDQSKLSAAWLVEQAGFRDYHDAETGISTWSKQPLVFVNERAQSTQALLDFKDKVATAVKAKFDVDLQQEPLLLP